MIERAKIYILITSFLLGFVAVAQSRSYLQVNDVFLRDIKSNVFQEVIILKENNEDLRGEVDELETNLLQIKDQSSALEAIEEEIERYSKLNGSKTIFGPGVEVELTGTITVPWIVDLSNELSASGAQAISLNGIRILNSTAGFDTLPQGQILLNGSILTAPYQFSAIGESSVMIELLELPGGILSRIEAAFPETQVKLSSKDVIQMD
jgi:uncharacterized protein YlxW (UPF0749 family)